MIKIIGVIWCLSPYFRLFRLILNDKVPVPFFCIYFDPPYRPLNDTSNFNSYTQNGFDDKEQIRLRNFCKKIDELGHQWILSNSDVKNINSNDNFFDDLYENFCIKRVLARRNINSNPNKRGELTELLITNNTYEKIMSIAK